MRVKPPPGTGLRPSAEAPVRPKLNIPKLDLRGTSIHLGNLAEGLKSFPVEIGLVAATFEQAVGSAVLSAAPTSIPLAMPDFREGLIASLQTLIKSLRKIPRPDFAEADRSTPMEQQLEALANYPDNWDDEGAPAPNDDSVVRAREVLLWAHASKLDVFDIDADVLGGIAVYVRKGARQAWIGCMNGKGTTVVLSTTNKVEDHFMFTMDDSNKHRVLEFLKGGDGEA